MPANYVLLQRTTTLSSVASVTFSNIPQTGYTDLKIVVSARVAGSNQGEVVNIAFNGSGANISARILYGDAPSVNSITSTSNAFWVVGSGATSNTFGNSEVYLPNYTSSLNKSWSTDSILENNGGTYQVLLAGLWSQTAAINSITLTPPVQSFVANSTFSLYGIATVGVTPVTAPKATGGDIVETDGTYWYHTFLSSGLFTPSQTLTCDALVVGGGGGGCVGINGSSYGGGGAGGLVTEVFSKATTATAKVVTVGAGGAGSGTNAIPGTSGGTSSVVLDTTYTATGGGFGRTSGVGGSNGSFSGGSSDAGGNGGGGAGAGGNGGGANTGGNGTAGTAGSGVNSTILGYRIAGGSTGSANGTVPAAVDGGGRGSTDTPVYAGAAPTKFGGGGASVSTAAFRVGYTGAVVIRYPVA